MNRPPFSIRSDLVSNTVRQMASLSEALLKNAFSSVSLLGGQLDKVTASLETLLPTSSTIPGCEDDCCPPQHRCPPHCLAEITRSAQPGEVILVSFAIRNAGGQARTYQVGVRPLINQKGQPTPKQPTLSTTTVNLPPFSSVQVEMRVDLAGLVPGDVCTTEIVLREKNYNQNICFSLLVESAANGPTITPLDEKQMNLKWMGWQGHFYCEKHEAAGIAITPGHLVPVGAHRPDATGS